MQDGFRRRVRCGFAGQLSAIDPDRNSTFMIITIVLVFIDAANDHQPIMLLRKFPSTSPVIPDPYPHPHRLDCPSERGHPLHLYTTAGMRIHVLDPSQASLLLRHKTGASSGKRGWDGRGQWMRRDEKREKAVARG